MTRRIFALITGLSVLSCATFIWVYAENQPAAYFLMPFRFWELGLGSLIALSGAILPAHLLRHSRAVLYAALIGVIAVMMVPSELAPIWTTIGVVLGTGIAIGIIHLGGTAPKVLTNGLSVYIGRASYSLYLWHWPIVSLSVWTVGLHLWLFPIQLALTFMLGLASYHLVENPLRRSKWPARRDLTAAIAIASLLACSVMAFASYRYRVPNFSGQAAEVVQRVSPTPGYVAKASGRQIDQCFAEVVFADPTAAWAERVAQCSARAQDGMNLLFIGDSHAMDLFPMADGLFQQQVANVTNLFQPGCQIPPRDRARQVCDFGTQAVDEFTKALPQSSTSSFVIIRNNYAPRRLDGSLTAFMDKLEAFVDQTAQRGHHVVYVAPSPKYYGIGPTSLCSPQWFRPDWARAGKCENGLVEDRGEQLARRAEVFSALMDLQARRSDFDVFDPFDPLCGPPDGDGLCSPFRNGALIYRDTSHVTEAGSEILIQPFVNFLSTVKTAR